MTRSWPFSPSPRVSISSAATGGDQTVSTGSEGGIKVPVPLGAGRVVKLWRAHKQVIQTLGRGLRRLLRLLVVVSALVVGRCKRRRTIGEAPRVHP